jgi:cell division protein FtsI (penicillin-binding protein 3)
MNQNAHLAHPATGNLLVSNVIEPQVITVKRDIARPVEERRSSEPRPADPRKRLKEVRIVVGLLLLGFMGRLVWVQLVTGPQYATAALHARISTTTLPAHRGQITDRNGLVLATSVDRYDLTADPEAILGFTGNGRIDQFGNEVVNGALGVAQLLAPVLGVEQMELAARLNGETRYVVLARDLEPAMQRQINSIQTTDPVTGELRMVNLRGLLNFELVAKRIYPMGPVAGALLGFVDFEQVGQHGIERAH